MIAQPDLSNVCFHAIVSHPSWDYVHLPPTGFLLGVRVRVLGNDFRHDSIHFELATYQFSRSIGEFDLQPYFEDGGMVLPEPLPNFNSALPYILSVPFNHTFEITTINARVKEGW